MPGQIEIFGEGARKARGGLDNFNFALLALLLTFLSGKLRKCCLAHPAHRPYGHRWAALLRRLPPPSWSGFSTLNHKLHHTITATAHRPWTPWCPGRPHGLMPSFLSAEPPAPRVDPTSPPSLPSLRHGLPQACRAPPFASSLWATPAMDKTAGPRTFWSCLLFLTTERQMCKPLHQATDLLPQAHQPLLPHAGPRAASLLSPAVVVVAIATDVARYCMLGAATWRASFWKEEERKQQQQQQ